MSTGSADRIPLNVSISDLIQRMGFTPLASAGSEGLSGGETVFSLYQARYSILERFDEDVSGVSTR